MKHWRHQRLPHRTGMPQRPHSRVNLAPSLSAALRQEREQYLMGRLFRETNRLSQWAQVNVQHDRQTISWAFAMKSIWQRSQVRISRVLGNLMFSKNRGCLRQNSLSAREWQGRQSVARLSRALASSDEVKRRKGILWLTVSPSWVPQDRHRCPSLSRARRRWACQFGPRYPAWPPLQAGFLSPDIWPFSTPTDTFYNMRGV
jgi:hypothetical protein